MNKKDKFITVVIITLSIILILASSIYLITEKMIPGLIPLLTAVLMIPMIALWGNRPDKGKLYAILFATAAVLNMIAGIMQIIQAL